jgi:hypothetical protein
MDGARNVLLRYLDAKQHLWNTYFVEKISDITQCEPVESFEAIDSLLFKVLVCQVLGFELPKSHVLGADVVPQIKVIARPQLTDIPTFRSFSKGRALTRIATGKLRLTSARVVLRGNSSSSFNGTSTTIYRCLM